MTVSRTALGFALLFVSWGAAAASAQVDGDLASSSGREAAEANINSLVPCPFTPAELEAAMGFQVGPGEPASMTFPGGRDVACSYSVINRSTILTVRQTWGVVPPPVEGAPAERSGKVKLRRIPNDPDEARWLLESSGERDHVDKVKLKYKRAGNKVDTELSVYGGYFKPVDIQTKLSKLKRVP